MSRAAAGRKRMLKQTQPPSASPTEAAQPSSNVPSSPFGTPFKSKKEKGKKEKGKGKDEVERKEETEREPELDAYLDLNASSSGLSHHSSSGSGSGSGSGSVSHSQAGSHSGSGSISVSHPDPTTGSGSGSGSSSAVAATATATVSTAGSGPDQFIFPTSRSKARPRPGASPTPVGPKFGLGKRKSRDAKEKRKGHTTDGEPNGSGPSRHVPPQLRVITTSSPSTMDTGSDFSAGSNSALSSMFPISPVSPSRISTSTSEGALQTSNRSHYSHGSDMPRASTSTQPVSAHSIHSSASSLPGPLSEPTSPSIDKTTISASSSAPGAQTSAAPLSPPISPPASSYSSPTSPHKSPRIAPVSIPFVFPTSRSRGHPNYPPLPVKLREVRRARARRASASGSVNSGDASASESASSSVPTHISGPAGDKTAGSSSIPRGKWMGIPLNTIALTGSRRKDKGKGKETMRLPPVISETDIDVLDVSPNNVGLISPPSPLSPGPSRSALHLYPQTLSSAFATTRARSRDSRATYFTHLSNGTSMSHSTLAPDDSYSQMGNGKDKDALKEERYWAKHRDENDAYDGDDNTEDENNRYSFSRPTQRRLNGRPRGRLFDANRREGDDWPDEDQYGFGYQWDAESYVSTYDDGEGWEDDERARYHSRAYTFRSYTTEEEGQAVLERGLARVRERERFLKIRMERETERERRRSESNSNGGVEGYKEYGDIESDEGEWDEFDYNYEEDERKVQRWGLGAYPLDVHDETLLESDFHTHNLLQRLIQHSLSGTPSPLSSATPSPHSPSTPSPSTPSSENSPHVLSPPTHTSKSSPTTPISSTPTNSSPSPSTFHPNPSLSTLSAGTFHPTPSIVLGPPLPSPSFHNYGLQPPASVLDLGCGYHGLWVREAAKAWGGFGTRIVGMDLDVQAGLDEEDDDRSSELEESRRFSNNRPPISVMVEVKVEKSVNSSPRTPNGQVLSEKSTDSPLRVVGGLITEEGSGDDKIAKVDVGYAGDGPRLPESDVESILNPNKAVQFVKGNFLVSPLPFTSSSFDLVRIANLTYAIPYEKWELLLQEVSRVLTIGGRLEIVDDHVFFAYGKSPATQDFLEEATKRKRPVSGSETVLSSESDEGSYYFRHSLTPSQYSAFSFTSPGSTSPSSRSSPTRVPSGTVASSSASLPASTTHDNSPNYQKYLEVLYRQRYLHQAWKNQQTTSQSLESLFEHLMNMKYGIHLCPSEFLEGLLERVMGFSRELGSWHFVLMKPEVGEMNEAVAVNARERKKKRKDGAPSPAAAIASDFRSRTMTALIANLGLSEDDQNNEGGADDTSSSEDDSDDGDDVLKTSPGLMLWPHRTLPMSTTELQANVLKHARVLLAYGKQLGRYAGHLEVMKYRFEREELKARIQKEGKDQEVADFDLDPEEQRELEHELLLRVESEVQEALEEYRSFLHGRFNPPQPLPAASKWKSATQTVSHEVHSTTSSDTLHDDPPQLGSASTPPESSNLNVHVDQQPTPLTPRSTDFSHHSRNASAATMSSISSDAKSAIWDYQSELQDHISWRFEDEDEEAPETPDTPRAHIRVLEVDEDARTPSPRIRSPSIYSRTRSRSKSSRFSSNSSDSRTRAASEGHEINHAESKAEDEPTLVRTFHVYEGIKLDGSVLAIGTAI